MSQEQIRRDERPKPEDLPPTPAVAPAALVQDQQIDDLLDEIGEILEVNAEVFVRGFVQKGGQ